MLTKIAKTKAVNPKQVLAVFINKELKVCVQLVNGTLMSDYDFEKTVKVLNEEV